MLYIRLCDALNRHGVRYLLVGGLAVNLHGVSRSTMDVDIAVDSSMDQSAAWENVCAELNLRPRQPVTWAQMYSSEERHRLREEKNLIAFCLLAPEPSEPVIDILFDPEWVFAEAWVRRKAFTVRGVQIPLVSVQDLITMKEAAGRAKDLRDIEYLRRVSTDANES